MKQKSFETYKAAYKQGFIPIFVKDDCDTKKLVEGCLKAKLDVIEYTLRREDANLAIPRILKEYPELKVLTGSVLDSPAIIRRMRDSNPQLLTLDELAGMGVHGFVSMFEFSKYTLSKYSETHFLAPCARTSNEAFRMTDGGAHLIKMTGPDLSIVKAARSAPSHGFCPIFVTGGMTLTKIPEAIEAGAVCIASGFDLILKDKPADIDSDGIAESVLQYVDAVKRAREKFYPQMMNNINSTDDLWLASLPHYHPY